MNTVSIIRGTTPTHIFSCDIDLKDIDSLYLTYSQDGQTIIEKTLDDVTINEDDKTISVTLTQEDTLKFQNDKWSWLEPNTNYSYRKIKLQARIKFTDGTVLASDIILIDIEDILKDGEI